MCSRGNPWVTPDISFTSFGIKPEYEPFLFLLTLDSVLYFLLPFCLFSKAPFSLSEIERSLTLQPRCRQGRKPQEPAGPQLRARRLWSLFPPENGVHRRGFVALLGLEAAGGRGPLCPSVLRRAGLHAPQGLPASNICAIPPKLGLVVLRLNPALTPGSLTNPAVL